MTVGVLSEWMCGAPCRSPPTTTGHARQASCPRKSLFSQVIIQRVQALC